MWLPPVCVAETSTPMVPAPLASMAPLLATVSVPETLMVSVDAGVVTSGESVPLVTVIVVALTDGAATLPLSGTVAAAVGGPGRRQRAVRAEADRVDALQRLAVRRVERVEAVDALPGVAGGDVDRLRAVRRERDGLVAHRGDAPRAFQRAGGGVGDLDPVAGEVRRDVRHEVGDERRAGAAGLRGAAAERRQLRGLAGVAFVVDRQLAIRGARTLDPDAARARVVTLAAPAAARMERRESAAEIAVLDGDGAAAGTRAVGAVGVAGGLDRAGTGDLAAGDPDRSARAALPAAVGAADADGAVDDERRGVDADDAAAVRAAVGAAAAARFLRTVDAAVRREAGDRRAAVVHESESDVAAADVGGDRGERIRRLDRISLTADVDRAAAGDEERAGLDVERVRAADVDRLLHERRAVHDQQARELVMADDRRRAAGDGDGLEVVREVAVVDGGVRGDRLLRRDDGDARLLHAGALAVRRRRGRDGDDAAVGQA